MKAIILDKPERLRLLQMEEPQASGPDEALVRVRQVGVCGTDFHAFRGEQPFFTYPRILGHELGGRDRGGRATGARADRRGTLRCGAVFQLWLLPGMPPREAQLLCQPQSLRGS